MRQSLIPIFVALAISCSSVSEKPTVAPSSVPMPISTTFVEEKVIPDVPQSKPVFHEYIDEVASKAGIKRLIEMPLGDDDIEVRIWGGFGLTRLQGFILRRKNSSWKAHKIGYAEDGKLRRPFLVGVNEPSSGWQSTWESMSRHKLLTLPDAKAIKCEAGFEDGYSYVVELKKGTNYRTYMYDNPDGKFENRCPEADDIMAIARIVRDEYDGF